MNSKHAFQFGIAVMAITLLTAIPLFAQQGDMGPRGNMDPEERLETRLGFLDERLDLSDEQEESIRAILEKAQEEGELWREENAGASRADRRSHFMEHRAATNAAIQAILTDDQKTAFGELKDFRGPKGRGMKEGRGMRGGQGRKDMGAWHRKGAGFGGGLRALDLTSEQKEAFREILTEEQRAKLDRMLADTSRQGFRGRGRHGGPGMFLNQLDLTDEQKEQLKSMRENHRAAAKAWHEANPNATREERRAFRDAHQEGMKAMLGTVLTEEQMAKLDSLKTNHPMGRHEGMHGQRGWK